MSGPVVVVGAGVAGVAAAWSARRSGREVTLVNKGAGASALGSGAVDDVPWEQIFRGVRALGEPASRAAQPLSPPAAAFVAALDLWDVPAAARPWIATVAGRIRPARGRDRALLDVGAHEGALIVLPRADRAGWDADALAATLGADPFARSRRLVFRAVDLPVLRFDDEHRIGDADLATRHDDPARLAWLSDRLRAGLSAVPGAGAVLLGPWLGAAAPRAGALSAAVGLPCGEALVGVGSPAGLRFEAARDRLLDTVGVRRVRDRVTRVSHAAALTVSLAGAEAPLVADTVVLAIGGVAAGGVVYAPPEHLAGTDLSPAAKRPFELSLEAPVVLSADGVTRLGVVSSMHGTELDVSAWPIDGRPGALEIVGILCTDDGGAPGAHDEGEPRASGHDGIYAAGDVVAGRARTVLEAVTSGLAAARVTLTR